MSNIKIEHELKVGNVILRSFKESRKFSDESRIIVGKFIDDRRYVLHRIFKNEILYEEIIDTNINSSDLHDFQKEWIEKWTPKINEEKAMKRYLEKIL